MIMSGQASTKMAWALLLSSVILNAIGQIFFKAARVAHPDATMVELFFFLETWAGFVLYGLSAVCWLWVLSRAQLSFAYPVLSLSFPIVVGLSVIFFSEFVTPIRWLGVGIIVFGVSLLARS
jgi:drug/metabolite transporter (DMT)-like permease